MSVPTNIFVRTGGLEKITLQIKAWTLQIKIKIYPTNNKTKKL